MDDGYAANKFECHVGKNENIHNQSYSLSLVDRYNGPIVVQDNILNFRPEDVAEAAMELIIDQTKNGATLIVGPELTEYFESKQPEHFMEKATGSYLNKNQGSNETNNQEQDFK